MPLSTVCILVRGISTGILVSSFLVAQNVPQQRQANAYHVPASRPAFVSPEIHADRTVTFSGPGRLRI
jgi:hypothetical protein